MGVAPYLHKFFEKFDQKILVGYKTHIHCSAKPMPRFFTTILLALLYTQAIAVDFKTYYLQRIDKPPAELKLLLHLYQIQLHNTITRAHYHRYLLHSLLKLPPADMPAVLQLPTPINLPKDNWTQKPRLNLHTATTQNVNQLHPELTRLLATHIHYHSKNNSVHNHLATHTDEHNITQILAQTILQALQADNQQLQQLQALAQRLPITRQWNTQQQRQASATLRSLVLATSWQEAALNNAEQGMLEQLIREQQRQRRWLQLIVGGSTLTATLLLGHGVRRLHRIGWRKLWSQRVLGMHLGYSITTLAALYPTWQLAQAGKRHLQRYLQTPPDMRGQNDYRIAYLAFITNPHNLQRQQQTLLTLNRCVQTLLKPLFAADEVVIKVNPQQPHYRSDHNDNRVTIAVPYSISHTQQLTPTLIKIISHHRQETLPAFALPPDITKYCRHDKA